MPKRKTVTVVNDKPRHVHKPNTYKGPSLNAVILVAVLSLLAYYYCRDHHEELPQPADDHDLHDIFQVLDIPGKGKGAIALRDIKQGELILRERPLFTVPPKIGSSPLDLMSERISKLNSQQYDAFFNLSYVNFPAGLDPKVHRDHLALAIFQTNAVSAGSAVGIFPRMARLNHGCSSAFNVVYNWRDREGILVVHALKPIKAGQELLTTYSDMKRSRSARRDYLSQQYGFFCTCSVCSLPDLDSKASDDRLTAISDLYVELRSWGEGKISGPEAIQVVRRIWAIEDEEGYWSERGRLAADAVWVAAAHSDTLAVQEWAKLSARWAGYELGRDSDLVQEMERVAAEPWTHQSLGTRSPITVGGPSLGSTE